MKVCVLVKEVPDARASSRIQAATGRLDRSVESGLNGCDRNALEAAVQLRDAFDELEIVAVTMGPAVAERTLRRAAALGADRGVHLCDEALAGSDVAATAYALARVLQSERPQLILCGEQSSDAGSSVLPALVAEHLQVASVLQASSLRAAGDGQLKVERRTELGTQTLSVTLPAVISVTPSANTPRYVSLKETIAAKDRAIVRLSCEDAGIAPALVGACGSMVSCGDWHEPPVRAPGIVITPATADDGAQLIVAWLAERKLV